MALLLALLALGSDVVESAAVNRRLDNGVGAKPAMGFNNWNSGLPSTAATALSAANQFVSLGLKDLGYQYINMDDLWMASTRDANGNLQPNPTTWPQGIANVTSQIHALGLKFGLYGDSGTTTCSGYPGSQGYEAQDAKQLAAWAVDYWKYDNCATPSGNSEPRYALMGKQLLAAAPASRPILYSLCNWGADSVYTWGATVGNSWRVGGDITNSWSSVASIAAANAAIASYAQPGGFNDFDMMEIGNGGLTAAEERAHFGLWAISKSPLLLGTDLSKISASSLAIIKNTAVIAINQDSLGKAAALFQPTGQPAPVSNQLYPYWAGPLSDGVVIGLVAANGAATLSVNFADVPGLGAGTYSWTELWSGKTGSGTSVSAALGSHDMAIYKVKTSGSPGTSTSAQSTHSSTTSSAPHTTTAPPTTSSTATSAAPTSSAPTSGVAQWGQCGGIGYAGSTTCLSPYTCHVVNSYYSQCY